MDAQYAHRRHLAVVTVMLCVSAVLNVYQSLATVTVVSSDPIFVVHGNGTVSLRDNVKGICIGPCPQSTNTKASVYTDTIQMGDILITRDTASLAYILYTGALSAPVEQIRFWDAGYVLFSTPVAQDSSTYQIMSNVKLKTISGKTVFLQEVELRATNALRGIRIKYASDDMVLFQNGPVVRGSPPAAYIMSNIQSSYISNTGYIKAVSTGVDCARYPVDENTLPLLTLVSFFGTSSCFNQQRGYMITTRVVLDLSLPYVCTYTANLPDGFSTYPMICIPTNACTSDNQSALIQYIESTNGTVNTTMTPAKSIQTGCSLSGKLLATCTFS